jgi:hypothetical protein
MSRSCLFFIIPLIRSVILPWIRSVILSEGGALAVGVEGPAFAVAVACSPKTGHKKIGRAPSIAALRDGWDVRTFPAGFCLTSAFVRLRANGFHHCGSMAGMTASHRRLSLLLAIISVGELSAVGQVVCTPKNSCSCNDEIVRPNLQVNEPNTAIHLNLHDASGAPFAHNKIILAAYEQGKVGAFREIAETSDQGIANFTVPSTGDYRLLVLPARLWNQPSIRCESKACAWSGILQAEGTDQPYSVCPPK